MLPRGSLAIITADVGTVVAHAAVAFDVPAELLTGPARTFPLVHYRHVAMAAARIMGHSFPKIAEAFDRDHGTVISACKKVAADDELSRKAQTLAESISDTPGSLF